MFGAEALDLVVQECRFVVNRGGALAVSPELDRHIAPLQVIELIDSGAGRTQIGYPVVRSPRLLAEVLRVLGTDVGRLLHNIDALPDGELLPAEALKADPFHRLLSDLLIRTQAHGAQLRLDSTLWLHLSRVAAAFLHFDRGLLSFVAREFPDEAQKGERYLAELLRLKGSNLAHHAQVKLKALRGFWQRLEHIHHSLVEVVGERPLNPLLGELLAAPVVFTEKPDGLYSFFDLREIFAVLQPRITLDDFTDIQRTVRSVIEDAMQAERAHRATTPERWFVQEFITDEVLEKAGRLELADAGGAVAPGEQEAFSSKVAFLLSLQAQPVRYLLHHLEHFSFLKSVTRRYELRKEFLKRLKSIDSLRDELPAFLQVQKEILRWDLFNTLRGFVRELDKQETRFVLDGRPLRASVSPLDLVTPKEVYRRKRHGTVVVTDLGGFRQRLPEVFGGEAGKDGPAEFDPDFGALCVQHILALRPQISAWKGRPAFFATGRVVDLFPRALDAIRYVAASLDALDQARMVRPGVGEAPRINPFTHDACIGLGTGEWYELDVPGDESPSGPPRSEAAGAIVTETRQLVSDGPRSSGRVGNSDEYDPLELFRVRVDAGRIDNRGICSFERTWKEFVAALRLEGLQCWTPQNAEVRIAGRVPALKNYRLELIVEDPITAQIFAGRRVDGLVDVRSPRLVGKPVPVYEYLLFRHDTFIAFLDRASDVARHQATLHSGPQRKPPSSASMPSVATEGRRARVQGARGPGADSQAVPSHERLRAVSEKDHSKRIARERGGADGARRELEAQRWNEPAPSLAELNLPTGDDFALGFAQPENSAIEERLGFQWGAPQPEPLAAPGMGEDFFDVLSGLGEPPPAPVDAPRRLPSAATPKAPAPAASPPNPLAELGWALDPLAHDAPIDAPGPGESEGGFDPGFDPFATPSGDLPWSMDLPSGSSPKVQMAPRSTGLGEGAGERSILGALEPELMARIRGIARVPQSAAPGAPDFGALFRGYVWMRSQGAQGLPQFLVARREGDVLFDVHRLDAPRGSGDRFELDEALVLFLREKMRANFIPQSLSYEDLPDDPSRLLPIDPAQLSRAYQRMPS